MPTIQEIIAKREELAKTNPNATNVDARKALTATVTTPVTPAPVAGVPPATPPATPTQTPTTPVTPPAPVVPQVTGVDGQKFTQAPVDPTTGLSKPIETAPITESVKAPAVTTPKPLKTEVPADYTQAKGREQEITANLESFKAQGMTPEQILKASDYANASPEKKAMIEPYLKQTQPTIDSMFNSIVAKVDVPDAQKVLPSYKIAQNRYLKANMYASMTPSQVTQEMNASRLIEGSRTWEDLKTLNPKLAQDAQNLRIVNGSKSNIFTPVNNPDGTPVKDENGNPVVENNLIKTFTQDYLDDYGDFLREIYKPETMEEINAKIRTPDAISAENEATKLEIEMANIEKDINSIEAEIDKETAGSGATGSRKRLEKSIRAERLQNDYNAVLKKYTAYANKANNIISQNTAIYQQAYKQNQALQNALATAGGAKFQSELALTTKQAEFEQKLAQQAQMASDPISATNQIIDTFAEMGIMADRSRQEIIADVQNKVARGIPLGQALTELQSAFKSKPLYKSMVDAQMRSLAPATTTTTPDWKQDASGNWYDAKSTVSPAEQIATNSTYLNVPRTGNNVGKDTNNPGNIMGDTEAQRNIALGYGAVGFYKSPNGRTYAVFPNMEAGVQASMADLQAKLSGGSSWATPNTTLEKFASGWVSGPNAPINQNAVANYVKLTGYPKNTPISQIPIDVLAKAIFANEGVDISKSADLSGIIGTGTTGTQVSQYTDQNIADLAYLTELQEKNPTQAAKDMKELGYTARDLANYKSGNVPLTEKQKNTSLDIMSAIKDLTDNDRYEWNDAVGKFDPTRIIGSQDAEDATVAINNLVAKLTLPNLGVLKGPMSDKDIQFIKEASSKLSTTQSNKSFERNLIDAYNLAARRAGQPEIKSLSDLSADSQSTVGGEAEYSKYE